MVLKDLSDLKGFRGFKVCKVSEDRLVKPAREEKLA
jgi:hypothetical protein